MFIRLVLLIEREWMSDESLKRAASKDKLMHIVENSNHMKFYDVPRYVGEAVSVLTPFFKKHLTDASAPLGVAAEKSRRCTGDRPAIGPLREAVGQRVLSPDDT
jgi:hypothetical protein